MHSGFVGRSEPGGLEALKPWDRAEGSAPFNKGCADDGAAVAPAVPATADTEEAVVGKSALVDTFLASKQRATRR